MTCNLAGDEKQTLCEGVTFPFDLGASCVPCREAAILISTGTEALGLAQSMIFIIYPILNLAPDGSKKLHFGARYGKMFVHIYRKLLILKNNNNGVPGNESKHEFLLLVNRQ